MRVFNGETKLLKVVNIALLPFMAVASGIALVVYVTFMSLTVIVIQAVGVVLGIYSALKWVFDATLNFITGAPLPSRK